MEREIDQMQVREGALTSGVASLNLEKYLPEVEGQFDSDEAAREFLRTLFEIMCAFVDIGWGVDSIHLAFPELAENSSPDSEYALVSLDQNIENEFATVARNTSERETP